MKFRKEAENITQTEHQHEMSFLRTVVLNKGSFGPPESSDNVFRQFCHNLGECYWHLVGWGQRCCWTSYNAHDNPTGQIPFWLKISIVLISEISLTLAYLMRLFWDQWSFLHLHNHDKLIHEAHLGLQCYSIQWFSSDWGCGNSRGQNLRRISKNTGLPGHLHGKL